MKYYTWSRYGGLECSSRGDMRFSALFALLRDGKSIEQHYQCGVKGYRTIKAGKGLPPLSPVKDLFGKYKALWKAYFDINPGLLEEAATLVKRHGNCFSDMFATSPISQARAIAMLLNERIMDERKYHYHVDGTRPEKSIFVFGSNLSGVHGKGAALEAKNRYGAFPGESEGMMDCSYGIPTVDYLHFDQSKPQPLPLTAIEASVTRFKQTANEHHIGTQKYRFFVTRVACELAGYSDKEIAPMFRNSPPNCSFAEQWMAYLE